MSGWPDIRWKMKAPDDSLSIDFRLIPKHLFILPDSFQRSSCFSMWISVCSINGVITIDGIDKSVSGTAFYDHPRVVKQNNDLPEFGSYNYIPIAFEDGSALVSYYSTLKDNK